MEIELDARLLPETEKSRAPVGDDDRKIVPSGREAPWRFICCLEYREGPKWWPFAKWVAYGTGWLAAPDKVVTAAHCLRYPEDHQRYPDFLEAIRVSPGRQGNSAPFGFRTSRRYASGWDELPKQEWTARHDYAVIQLPQAFPGLEGWFEFGGPLDPESLVGRKVHVSGYPADDSQKGVWQLHHEDLVLKVENGVIHYQTDTSSGQSGAPVFVIHPGSPGRGTVEVVGVHSRATDSEPSNCGPLLCGSGAERVARWVKEGPGAGGALV